MVKAMWTFATAMNAQQTNIDVIANNISNVNTTGFQKDRAEFQDLMYQNAIVPSSVDSVGSVQVGSGVATSSVTTIFSQGNLYQTKQQLDMAVEGAGFFKILLPGGGEGYSRAGAFKRNSDGYMVTADGYYLVPSIQIPAGAESVIISADGEVSIVNVDEPEPITIGQIQLTLFANPSALRKKGHNIYLSTSGSGNPEDGRPGDTGRGIIAQGFLESSNVNIAEEMIEMIKGQRAYELSSKGIQTADELMAMANNLRR